MASGATCTVSVVLPVTDPEVAEIVVVPPATPVARPDALTVATAGADDAQVTCSVRFCVLPSEYVPGGRELLRARPPRCVGPAGVTAIDVRRRGGACALKTTSTQ